MKSIKNLPPTKEAIFIYAQNIAFLLLAIFFNFNLLEILTILLVEGAILTSLYCILVLTFPKFVITNYKKILVGTNWKKYSSRLFSTIKVFIISTIYLTIFFSIHIFLTINSGAQKLDFSFINSTYFQLTMIIIFLFIIGNLLYTHSFFSKKIVRLRYSKITANAGIFAVLFVLTVIGFMLFSWNLGQIQIIQQNINIIFLFALVLAKIIVEIEVSTNN